jgi:hypothetical protein
MILKTTEQLRNEISAVKKILKISGENTKIAKTIAKAGGAVRIASLSMMPDAILCPGSKAAGCFDACLKIIRSRCYV